MTGAHVIPGRRDGQDRGSCWPFGVAAPAPEHAILSFLPLTPASCAFPPTRWIILVNSPRANPAQASPAAPPSCLCSASTSPAQARMIVHLQLTCSIRNVSHKQHDLGSSLKLSTFS